MIRSVSLRATTLATLVLAACSSSTTRGGPCAPDRIPAGLGCEFFATVTANPVGGEHAFGVALVNPGPAAADVAIVGGALGAALELTLAPGSSEYRTLPWVDALKGCTTVGVPCDAIAGSSVVAAAGAYRITSTLPIAVYQLNPVPEAVESGTADVSALPGAHALGWGHVVASWEGQGAGTRPGLVAVTATEDGTTVGITPAAAIVAGDLPALAAGVRTTTALNRGDVLELLAPEGDLTGTLVDATRPVQVIGGHACAQVPTGWFYCDHLEDVMPPLTALGTTYVLVPPAPPSLQGAKPIVVRIAGTEDGTTLSYSVAVAGAPGTLAAGQFAEFALSQPVRINASRPVLVAQYLEGAEAGGGGGDPSLVVAPPVSRWRTSYAIEVPTMPLGAHADVIAPAAATVRLGDAPLQLVPLGGTSYGVAGVALGGFHRLESDLPFTVSVYGYGYGTSFWYVPAFAP
jgi:hypothetical protein